MFNLQRKVSLKIINGFVKYFEKSCLITCGIKNLLLGTGYK